MLRSRGLIWLRGEYSSPLSWLCRLSRLHAQNRVWWRFWGGPHVFFFSIFLVGGPLKIYARLKSTGIDWGLGGTACYFLHCNIGYFCLFYTVSRESLDDSRWVMIARTLVGNISLIAISHKLHCHRNTTAKVFSWSWIKVK